MGTIVVAVWLSLACSAGGADIRLPDGRSCVFADSILGIPVQLQAAEDIAGRLAASLMLGRDVIGRQEVAVAVSRERVTDIVLKFELPEGRAGVILDCRLELVWIDATGRERATQRQAITIFPPDPFAHRRAWLTRLNLHVYDPDGASLAVFDALAIPYRRVTNPDALAHTGGGVLIIGEGLSLREHRGLFEIVARAARAGTPVLMLAPASGSFRLPGQDDDDAHEKPEALLLRERDIIRELDKRFDSAYWADGVSVAASRFRLDVHGGRPAFLIDPDHGWSWMELKWEGGRRMSICGFAIVRDWEASPVPRYLFARMLERVSNQKERER